MSSSAQRDVFSDATFYHDGYDELELHNLRGGTVGYTQFVIEKSFSFSLHVAKGRLEI